MGWLLLILSLACLVPVHGIIELRGEYLYLRPSMGNREYVVADRAPFDDSAVQPRGDVHAVTADYGSGFRLALGWLDRETLYNGSVSYTRLHKTNQDTTVPSVEGGGLWLTVGYPDRTGVPLISGDLGGALGVVQAIAMAQHSLDYDAAELQVGHRSHHNDNFCLRTWGAIHFAHIQELRRVTFRGINPDTPSTPLQRVAFDTSARVWGLGPKVGVDFRLSLLCGLGVGGSFAASLLAGDRAYTLNEQSDFFDDLGDLAASFPLAFRYPHGLAFFTDLHARLGINYGICSGCFSVLVEVGYEWIDYVNALPGIGFANQGLAFFTLCQDARFDGIYAAVRLEF